MLEPGFGLRIHWANTSDSDSSDLSLLDGIEKERRDAYLREDDRRRFTLGVVWSKRLVAEREGKRPDEIVLDRTCKDCGKPHGPPRYPGSHISVTHSGVLAGIAVADVPLGIDVEQRDRPLTEVASHVLAPGEHHDDLHILWTRKEALLKATGDGLRVPMTDLTVSGPGEPVALLDWAGRPGLADRIALYDLDPEPGYAAALAMIIR